MSALKTPDAWKELCQLLETRKQVLDSALVRTLDDKCPAGYFQVARSLMLDQEKMLHWFISLQQNAQSTPSAAATTSPSIVKPINPPSSAPIKRAGFIKPAILALLGIIFFFVIVLVALIQGEQPPFPESGRNAEPAGVHRLDQPQLARDLPYLYQEYGFHRFCSSFIMEQIHGLDFKTTRPRKMDDAPSAARFTDAYQVRIAPCHQSLPHVT